MFDMCLRINYLCLIKLIILRLFRRAHQFIGGSSEWSVWLRTVFNTAVKILLVSENILTRINLVDTNVVSSISSVETSRKQLQLHPWSVWLQAVLAGFHKCQEECLLLMYQVIIHN